jgi:hypothetical protein
MNYNSLIFYSNISVILGGIILLAFALFVLVFRKKFKRVGITFIYRTKLGKQIIEALGKHERFFRIYGYIGIVIAILFIAFGIYNIALYYVNFAVFQSLHLSAVELALPIYIPGISIGVPILYWLIAIIVAIIPHELSHGVVARAHRLKIKNTGFGFAFGIIPIAFVELNEKKMFKSSLKSQLSVISAGAFSNIVIGFIALIIYVLVAILLITQNQVYFAPIYLNISPVTNYSAQEFGIPINHSLIVYAFNNKSIEYNSIFIPFVGQIPAFQNGNKIYYNFVAFNITQNASQSSIFLNQLAADLQAANQSYYLNANKTIKINPVSQMINGKTERRYGIIFRPIYSQVQPYTLVPIIAYNSFPKNNLYSVFMFWLAGLMLWIFIFSFGIGIINILPVFLISDGTMFIFAILNKALRNEKLARKIANGISLAFTFVLLFSIVAIV